MIDDPVELLTLIERELSDEVTRTPSHRTAIPLRADLPVLTDPAPLLAEMPRISSGHLVVPASE